ncbi:hypothetical protein ASPSYDRAFT_39679 [Aspergillus sydowii CBS 593.65]|uniref:YggU family protein n=1 Tax=Aspergillus sydowii CBS 593.65 TaxID=1036612 RepID=A0A1L9TZN8_9EURO|nr:uncharacterized protein ASPSYDRAFT_39679 [Aspergillus sydowii CBS 593.65]OJJ64906.1 hypothetical protein ASPSYDRAFT_39679 [Aspergillus sydowii CBS 593.65]
MSSPMIRLIRAGATAPRSKNQDIKKRYSLQISCRVKPNASGNREGITAIGTEKVDVCVAAVPRNGEANTAVSRVFSKVLNVPKSDVGVIHGMKSRDKIISIANLEIGAEGEEEYLQKAHQQLQEAVVRK